MGVLDDTDRTPERYAQGHLLHLEPLTHPAHRPRVRAAESIDTLPGITHRDQLSAEPDELLEAVAVPGPEPEREPEPELEPEPEPEPEAAVASEPPVEPIIVRMEDASRERGRWWSRNGNKARIKELEKVLSDFEQRSRAIEADIARVRATLRSLRDAG